MQVQTCEHPVIITNKYTGERQTVPCGKCVACQNQKRSLWSQRLQQECQCHKYTLIATLQYDEYHVPQLIRYDGYQGYGYLERSTGFFVDLAHPSIKRREDYDIDYIKNQDVLLVHQKVHHQKFIKLLRYYAKQIDPECKIRYFSVGEYGETTFRPHYHTMLWFDSDSVARKIKEIIRKSWKHGTVYDPHFITGSSSQPSKYVTNYVTSLTKLPSIYQHINIRPFYLFSKQPPIGCLQDNTETLQRLFFEKASERPLYCESSGTFKSVPLPRSIRDRLYGKIPRFSNLSHARRVELYRFGCEVFETSEEFAIWCFRTYCEDSGNTTWLHHYFRDICTVFQTKDRYTGIYYPTPIEKVTLEPLKRFWRIVNNICFQASCFNLSIDDYVSNIEAFYEKREKDSYASFINFCNITKNIDSNYYIFMDYEFIRSVDGKSISLLPEWKRELLLAHGFVDDATEKVSISLSDSRDYVEFMQFQHIIANNDKSTKRRNDYLFAHSNVFKAQIQFFNHVDYLNHAKRI